MATITKKDLIDRIATASNCKRVEVKKVIQHFLDEMIAELGQGNRLEFRDFGVFEIKARAPRVAQNPKTLERVEVPAKRTVKFKVGRLLKEQLDGDELSKIALDKARNAKPGSRPDMKADGKTDGRSHVVVRPEAGDGVRPRLAKA